MGSSLAALKLGCSLGHGCDTRVKLLPGRSGREGGREASDGLGASALAVGHCPWRGKGS